jgi:hypothetical protein
MGGDHGMMYVYIESFGGGVNNLFVAVASETGESATSRKSPEQAIRNLKRKLRTARKS